jgi:hypothetical protein
MGVPTKNPNNMQTCCNCNLKKEKSSHPSNYRGCSSAEQELQRRKNLKAVNARPSGEIFFSSYSTPDRSFAELKHQQQSSGYHLKQFTSQISGQSLQWTKWRSRAWLNSQVSWQEKRRKVAVITRAVLNLRRLTGCSCSRSLKIKTFNTKNFRRQACEVAKQSKFWRIDVTFFSETYLKSHMTFYIPNYNIYRTNRYEEHDGGIAIAVRRGIPHMRRPSVRPFSRSYRGLQGDTQMLLEALYKY